MKTVKRLVTEFTAPGAVKSKQVFNEYWSDTVVGINNIQKPVVDAEVGDTLDGKGIIVNIATFEYGDDENPTLLAA